MRREQLLADVQLGLDATVRRGEDLDPEQARQVAVADPAERVPVYFLPAADDTYLATA